MKTFTLLPRQKNLKLRGPSKICGERTKDSPRRGHPTFRRKSVGRCSVFSSLHRCFDSFSVRSKSSLNEGKGRCTERTFGLHRGEPILLRYPSGNWANGRSVNLVNHRKKRTLVHNGTNRETLCWPIGATLGPSTKNWQNNLFKRGSDFGFSP